MSVVTASQLTASGNEVTDAARAAALLWPTTQQGGQTDGLTNDGSFFIGRAATNKMPRSQVDALSTNWVIASGTTGTANLDTTVPGKFSPNTCRIDANGSGVATLTTRTSGGQALAAGTTCVGSIFVKGVAGKQYKARFRITNTDTTTDNGTFGATFTADGTTQQIGGSPSVADIPMFAVQPGKTGDSVRIDVQQVVAAAESFYGSCAMIETGQTVVAPYVPTSGGVTATKAAAWEQFPAALLNATQCAVAFRVVYDAASTATRSAVRHLFDLGDDANNRLRVYLDTDNTWKAERLAGGAGSHATSAVQTFAAGDAATIVFACDSGTVKVSVNGAPAVTVANTAIPTLATLIGYLGSDFAQANQASMRIKWAAFFTGTLTDADAAAISALPASPDPSFNAFPSPTRAGMSAYWTADTVTYWTIGPAHVVRDTVNGWCSWGAYNVGILSFDSSDFDSADVFGVSPLDATFGGAYDDISARLQRIVIRRGRNDNLTTMLAGDADVDLRDPAGIFNTDNAASPLYGQLEDRLHPIKIQSTYSGSIYPRMYMWVDKFTWQPSGRRGITQLHCIDLFYWLDGCFPVIASTGPTTTGAVIGLILNAAGATDPAMRDLDVGDTIPDFSADGSASALSLIGNLLEAERGVFFVAGTGKATYRSRLARLTKTSIATITDHMNQLNPGVDFNQLQTRVRVTRTQSGYTSTQVAAGSVLQKRGYRDLPEISTPYLLSDSQADGLAAWVLSQVSSPKPPIEEFTVDNREDSLLAQILARELVDRITVHDTRGGTVGDFHIDSITETIDYSTAAAIHQAEWLLSRASEIMPAEFDIAEFDAAAEFVY